MAKERVVQLGGETLRVGDIVVVMDGGTQHEVPITSIGTQKLYVRMYGRDEGFRMDTRSNGSTRGHGVYFKTRTEVAADEHRRLLIKELEGLGFEITRGGRHSNETLCKVVELLKSEANEEK